MWFSSFFDNRFQLRDVSGVGCVSVSFRLQVWGFSGLVGLFWQFVEGC